MHSIRFRFVLFTTALLVVLLFLLNTYPLLSSRDAVFEEKNKAMNSQGSVLAFSLIGLERLSESGVTEMLAYLDLPPYERIIVTDERLSPLYDSAEGEPLPEADLGTALLGKTVFRSRFRNASFTSSLALPLQEMDAVEGTLYLQELDTERGAGIQTLQRRLLIFSLAFGSCALLLAVISIHMVTLRLHALILSMRTVADGEYRYRHVVTGQDEISMLGEELNHLTQQLERNEAEQRRFVADASHELKTPLASIRLLSDSVLQNDDMDPSTVREFISGIGDEALRLQRTTEKLLRLSRLETGMLEAPTRIDLREEALSVLAMLRPLTRDRQLQLEHELAPGCVIRGSREAVEQILFNLLENAVKYTPPGGSVALRLRGEEDSVSILVEDTGIGIPDADLPYIFDRFYRVDKARSRAAGGSGLGLSIVHNAVLSLGGRIGVEKNTPRGTRFIVLLPREKAEETEL